MRQSKVDGLKPRKVPIFPMGATIKICTKQHPMSGQVGVITRVSPLQNNVFYTVEFSPGRCARFPERMLQNV